MKTFQKTIRNSNPIKIIAQFGKKEEIMEIQKLWMENLVPNFLIAFAYLVLEVRLIKIK
mgnify:CR=1 FL=1